MVPHGRADGSSPPAGARAAPRAGGDCLPRDVDSDRPRQALSGARQRDPDPDPSVCDRGPGWVSGRPEAGSGPAQRRGAGQAGLSRQQDWRRPGPLLPPGGSQHRRPRRGRASSTIPDRTACAASPPRSCGRPTTPTRSASRRPPATPRRRHSSFCATRIVGGRVSARVVSERESSYGSDGQGENVTTACANAAGGTLARARYCLWDWAASHGGGYPETLDPLDGVRRVSRRERRLRRHACDIRPRPQRRGRPHHDLRDHRRSDDGRREAVSAASARWNPRHPRSTIRAAPSDLARPAGQAVAASPGGQPATRRSIGRLRLGARVRRGTARGLRRAGRRARSSCLPLAEGRDACRG